MQEALFLTTCNVRQIYEWKKRGEENPDEEVDNGEAPEQYEEEYEETLRKMRRRTCRRIRGGT